MQPSCRWGWLFFSCERHFERRCRCSVRRLSDVSIFTVPSNYGCNITSIFSPSQVHIGSFSGAVGELIIKRSSSRPWCFGRRGGLAVFRFAGYTHIHSHCIVLLPLMSHFLKGKPEFEERWYGKTDRIRKMRSLSVLSILFNCEIFFFGSMHFRLAPNPFGNTFGLFCSSRVQPALLGNVSPTLCLPRGASGQSRAALLTIFASERLSGMRTNTSSALLGCIYASFRSPRVSDGAFE